MKHGEGQGKRSPVPYPEPFTKIPPPVTENKPGQLSEKQIRQFFEEGFTIVSDYFTPDELQPCRDAVGDLVEELAQKLYNAGKIKNLYREYGIFKRLVKLEEVFPGANILLFKQGKLPKAFMDIWSCDKLLNMVEQLIGPDIAGHPVWNLRVKTPKNDATTVPWHQDSAYFSEESYDHNIITAWIPFLDTNEHNGGMQMMRYSHKKGIVANHTCCHDNYWYVVLSEDEMRNTLGVDPDKDTVMCDVPYGGFLLFNNLTAHRSLPNYSTDVRWSIDLRWQSPHEKWGFYNIADGVLMRTAEKGNVTPDWNSFLKVNRKEVWQKRYYSKVFEADEFDTTVTGPWIGRWAITNENRHTKTFKAFSK